MNFPPKNAFSASHRFWKLCFHSGDSDSKEFFNAEDLGSILGLERSLGEENGYLPVFRPGEFQEQEHWRFTVHGIAKESGNN